ncbi:MAG: CvpA family protein [Kiritimatiellia bacterium]
MENFPPLNPVDIAALILLVIGGLLGYRRRLSGELSRMISVVAAFILGVYFCGPVSVWLIGHTRLTENTARLVGFIVTLVSVVAVMVFLRILLKRIMMVAFEPVTDRAGGVLAGLVRTAVLILIVFYLMILCPSDYLNRKFGNESAIGTIVKRNSSVLDETFEKSKERVRDIKDRIHDRNGVEEDGNGES